MDEAVITTTSVHRGHRRRLCQEVEVVVVVNVAEEEDEEQGVDVLDEVGEEVHHEHVTSNDRKNV